MYKTYQISMLICKVPFPVNFQSLLYNTVEDAQQRSKLSNELMIYHMQVGVN